MTPTSAPPSSTTHVMPKVLPEIAVDRIGGMKKMRGSAGARERGGNLLADDAGLAHSGEDDASPAFLQQIDGAIESLVETLGKREDRGRFGLQNFAGERAISHE